MHDPNRYEPPSSGKARIELAAGVFVGLGCFAAAWIANDELAAFERGEPTGTLMPSMLIDFYEWAGRLATVGALALFGVAMLALGIGGWLRKR